MRRGAVKVAWELGKISHANLVPKVFQDGRHSEDILNFVLILTGLSSYLKTQRAEMKQRVWLGINGVGLSHRIAFASMESYLLQFICRDTPLVLKIQGKFKNKNRSTTFMRNNLNTAMYFGIAHVHRAWDWPDQVSDETRTELKAFSSCLLPPCVKTSLRAKLFIIPLLVHFHTNPTLFPKKNSF